MVQDKKLLIMLGYWTTYNLYKAYLEDVRIKLITIS